MKVYQDPWAYTNKTLGGDYYWGRETNQNIRTTRLKGERVEAIDVKLRIENPVSFQGFSPQILNKSGTSIPILISHKNPLKYGNDKGPAITGGPWRNP